MVTADVSVYQLPIGDGITICVVRWHQEQQAIYNIY